MLFRSLSYPILSYPIFLLYLILYYLVILSPSRVLSSFVIFLFFVIFMLCDFHPIFQCCFPFLSFSVLSVPSYFPILFYPILSHHIFLLSAIFLSFAFFLFCAIILSILLSYFIVFYLSILSSCSVLSWIGFRYRESLTFLSLFLSGTHTL